MKILLLLSIAFFTPFIHASQVFQLSSVPISKAVEFYYSEVEQRSFTISPDVITNNNLVSFSFDGTKNSRVQFLNFLKSLNVFVKTIDGVDRVYYVKPKEVVQTTQIIQRTYKPLYRTSEEIKSDLSSFPDVSIYGTTTLVLRGPRDNVNDIMKALPDIDQHVPSVELVGYLYEVTSATSEGSGVSVLLSLLKGRFSVDVTGPVYSGNVVRISTPDFSAIFNLLKNDTRFSIVSNPSLRLRSGSEGRFVVGQKVPTVGSVTYDDGRPVQSIQYQDSGALFRVQADVLGETIKVRLTQELSEFTRTTTGVDQTPTLSTRTVESTVTARSGDVLVLGGLGSRKSTGNKQSLFGLTIGKDTDFSTGEIVLVLGVRVSG
ncbi:type II secretion system protein GspD [Klebsiella pneumoniae]|uniref:type II secretion system protein GspD n=1 Tax=Klebsiella pneumoniae TaxID=573 RepID=UPI00398EFAC9